MTLQTYTPAPGADFVLPFSMPERDVRGRVVRLDAMSARALSAHTPPEAPARVLSEALALNCDAGLLAQAGWLAHVADEGAGPLDLLTVDYYGSENGRERADLRGFARADRARFAALGEDACDFAKMVGEGALAIAIEPRLGEKRYRGIVPLGSESIAAGAEAYFMQSEQLPTAIRLAAAPAYVPGRQRAGMALRRNYAVGHSSSQSG